MADWKRIEFRASKVLGCDQYQKELKEILFEFHSVTEFRHFCRHYEQLLL